MTETAQTRSAIAGVGELDKLSVADTVALMDATLRQSVANRIVWTFVAVNAVVLAFVAAIFAADFNLLAAGELGAADRVVTAQVPMALIRAATVQLGAISVLIGKYLFPANAGG